MRLRIKPPLLLVDAGNLLFKGEEENKSPAALVAAHGIVRAYTQLAYDAVAVSPNDLSAGSDFFQASRAIGFPWISANIFDLDGRLLFRPAIIRKAGTLNVGIIGLTGKGQNDYPGTRIGDWRESLPEQIAELQATCDMLILLSNLPDDENLEIARDHSQLDIIVAASPTQPGNITPFMVGDSLLTQSAERGKYIGKLQLKWHPHGIAKNNTTPAYPNTFNATFLPVKPSSSGDSVDTIVQDIKNSTNAYQKARLISQGGEIPPQTKEVLRLHEFTGVPHCNSCHEKQAAFWAATAHAGAFTTLVKSGQAYNPECLPCHSTGGNITPSSSHEEKDMLLLLPENRQIIGCEACHGPGRRHSLAPDRIQPVRIPTQKICVGCHTPERDDGFHYERKMVKIACPNGL